MTWRDEPAPQPQPLTAPGEWHLPLAPSPAKTPQPRATPHTAARRRHRYQGCSSFHAPFRGKCLHLLNFPSDGKPEESFTPTPHQKAAH